METNDLFKKINKETEEYEATFGDLDISFDNMFFSEKYKHNSDLPTNALIEITLNGKTVRASIPVEDLLAKVQEMKVRLDESDYPAWLDERPTHMMSDGSLFKVNEVRFHPIEGMFAVVTMFDSSMKETGRKIVEITGHTDRKALARKLALVENSDEDLAKYGYIIWQVKG